MDVEDIFVAELMTTDLVTISTDTSVEEAAETLMDQQIGSLIVVDEANHLQGILTGTDFIEIVAKSNPKAETTVARYMSEDIVTVGAQDPLRDAADKMLDNSIQHLPVSDDTEGVIGILTSTDLTMYLSDTAEPSP